MNRVFRSQKSKRYLSPDAKPEASSKPSAQTEGHDIADLLGNLHSQGLDMVIVEAKTTDVMKNVSNVGSEVFGLNVVKARKAKDTQAELLRKQKLARVRKMKAKLILDINTDVGRRTSKTVRDAAAGK